MGIGVLASSTIYLKREWIQPVPGWTKESFYSEDGIPTSRHQKRGVRTRAACSNAEWPVCCSDLWPLLPHSVREACPRVWHRGGRSEELCRLEATGKVAADAGGENLSARMCSSQDEVYRGWWSLIWNKGQSTYFASDMQRERSNLNFFVIPGNLYAFGGYNYVGDCHSLARF